MGAVTFENSWHETCYAVTGHTSAMKQLQLANSNNMAIVDDEDFERLKKFRWYLHLSGSVARNYKLSYKTHHVSLASEVMQTKLMYDHIDRNKLNKTKLTTRKTASKYKGVSMHKKSGKWQAYIKKNYVQKNLGLFDNEHDAAIAYNKAAIEMFGNFAQLNSVE